MQAIDIDGNYHEVSPDEVTIRLTTYAIIIDDEKILLTKQHDRGYYLPGGGVEIDESFEAAVIREVKEETGIDVIVKEFVTMKDILFKVTFREPQETWRAIIVFYLCEKVGGHTDDSDISKHEELYTQGTEWVPLGQLDTLPYATKSIDWKEIVRAAIS